VAFVLQVLEIPPFFLYPPAIEDGDAGHSQTDGASQDPLTIGWFGFRIMAAMCPRKARIKNTKKCCGSRWPSGQPSTTYLARRCFYRSSPARTNEHGDDKGHSDVGQALFGQIFMKRRFFPFAEKALDDGN